VEANATKHLENLIKLLPVSPILVGRPTGSSADWEMPIILLYVDEMHSAQTFLASDAKDRTNYSALTRAIDSFKKSPLIAVFTSTTSRLYELAPSQMVHPSDRIIENNTIPLPFWELPFDVNIGKISRGLMLEQITSTPHIVKFGRSL